MDSKQSALLTELHGKFNAGNFGETDIQSFLGLVREESPKDGPIRELGDFASHRTRAYGPTHRYLKGLKKVFDRLGTQPDVMEVREIFSEAEISTAVDVAFAGHSLAALSLNRHRQVQLALLSMLQQVAFVDQSGKRFGHMELAVKRHRFELHPILTDVKKHPGAKVAFAGLSVANECFPMYSNEIIRPKGLIRVAVRDGETILDGLKPYDFYIERKRLKGGPEPTPLTWAELIAALHGLAGISARPDIEEFDVQDSSGINVSFRLSGGRVSFHGRPEYSLPQSCIWQIAHSLKSRLGAYVFDDIEGYLFETVASLGEIDSGV